MNISNLFKRKSEIERELSERKAKRDEAAKALALVQSLEATLPAQIDQIRAQPIDVYFTDGTNPEDFYGAVDLVEHRRQVEAAERLLKELPEIEKHWAKVAEGLAK